MLQKLCIFHFQIFCGAVCDTRLTRLSSIPCFPWAYSRDVQELSFVNFKDPTARLRPLFYGSFTIFRYQGSVLESREYIDDGFFAKRFKNFVYVTPWPKLSVSPQLLNGGGPNERRNCGTKSDGVTEKSPTHNLCPVVIFVQLLWTEFNFQEYVYLECLLSYKEEKLLKLELL